MNSVVRTYLIELARKGKTVTYQQLANDCGLELDMRHSEYDRNAMTTILSEVSKYEHEHKRPLLSSLVLSKDKQIQGNGFFKLCDTLGLGAWSQLRNNGFFNLEKMQETYEFWQKEANYQQHK